MDNRRVLRPSMVVIERRGDKIYMIARTRVDS